MISRLRRRSAFIEWLEPRIAPAANLVTTVTDLELPNPVVPGDSGRVTFEVRNDGPDDAIVQSDTTGIHIYLSADNQKNGADEPPIAELENLHSLDLPAAVTKVYHASFVIPPLTLPTPKYPAGANYFIVVEADAGFRVTNELNHADNDGASASFPLVFQFGAVGERTDVHLRARDTDGTVASFGVRGPGAGTLTVGGGQADLSVIDTTPKTAQLSGSASGGDDDRLAIRNISVTGPLKDVFLPGVNVTGAVSFVGGLGSLTLGGAVTLKTSKDPLSAANFVFAPDGTVQLIDLDQKGSSSGSINITVGGKQSAGGDELLNVGAINAVGIDLGTVKIQGDLGQIDAGSNLGTAIKSLTVGSLGTKGGSTQPAGTLNPLLSEVAGSLGKLTVKGDVLNAVVEVSEKLGKVLIGGSLIDTNPPAAALKGGSIGVFLNGGIPPAGASHAGTIFAPNIGSVTVMGDVDGAEISAEAQIKNVRIVGKLMSDDPLDPAILRVGESIDKVLINGDVTNALILAGYNRALQPRTSDANIGKVTVKGDWKASSVVAGIADPTDDGFGIDDTIIAGDSTPTVISTIASLIIKGTAAGSATRTDHSAVTAQKISALRISGEKVVLTPDKDDVTLDPLNQNFRAVEL